MGRIAATSLLGCLAFATAAFADEPVKEGRSVSACSTTTLVCAVMKDGSMRPTDECDARRDGPVRIIPGDCYDED